MRRASPCLLLQWCMVPLKYSLLQCLSMLRDCLVGTLRDEALRGNQGAWDEKSFPLFASSMVLGATEMQFALVLVYAV